MTINFTMMAQNSDVDYVRQATACAMSIKHTNPDSKICLITNDTVPEKFKFLFNDIVEIPWEDAAIQKSWKIQNRWKSYYACPYESTIVLDTDMLVLENIEHWWKFLQDRDLYFVSNPLTYRHEPVTSTYYRKAFLNHKLPNVYTGFHYFKKTDATHMFYKWLELVMNNWELFHGQYAGGGYFQKFLSMDVSAAIVVKILDWEQHVTCNSLSYPTFVHMKSYAQNWDKCFSDRWQDYVGAYLTDDLTLTIGNYVQRGLFHYTEDDFLTNAVFEKYENVMGLQ
jgi:hypothetical protein